jgi:hypothetical protein
MLQPILKHPNKQHSLGTQQVSCMHLVHIFAHSHTHFDHPDFKRYETSRIINTCDMTHTRFLVLVSFDMQAFTLAVFPMVLAL